MSWSFAKGFAHRIACTCPTRTRPSRFASSSSSTLDLDSPPPEFERLVPRQQTSKGRTRRARPLVPWLDSLSDHPRRSPVSNNPPRTRPRDPSQVSPYLPLYTRERNYLLAAFRATLHPATATPSSPSPLASRSHLYHRRRKRKDRGRVRTRSTSIKGSSPDATWSAFARVLKYPDEVPDLPRSYFPSSTRAPIAVSVHPSGPSPSTTTTTDTFDRSFPRPTRPSSSSLDRALTDDPRGLLDGGGDRTRIRLSHVELKRAFEIFASQRPRTRNGLNRLLVVTEVMARQRDDHDVVRTATSTTGTRDERSNVSTAEDDDGVSIERGSAQGPTGRHGRAEADAREWGPGTESETTLRGGGVGLSDRDWTQLMLFAGASLRSSRPDPDAQSVVALFQQREDRVRRIERERDEVERERTALVVVDDDFGGQDGSAPVEVEPRETSRSRLRMRSRSKPRRNETRLYNALLHVASRSRSWDLFDQVLERMRERGIADDAATFVERVKREDKRAASVEGVWRVFEEGLRWAIASPKREGEADDRRGGEGGGQGGKRKRKEARKVLWTVMLWVLARRGRLDDANKIYDAMKAQQTVALDDLRPAPDPARYSYSPLRADPYGFLDPLNPAVPPSNETDEAGRRRRLEVRLPKPDHRVYSSLVQAFAHHGHLRSALLTLYDMVSAEYPAEPHHFHHLFRAFVVHGQAELVPAGGAGAKGGAGLDHATVSGLRTRRGTTEARGKSPLSVLADSSLNSNSSSSSETEFTLSALSSILSSFLALRPPPPPPPASQRRPDVVVPFEGQRTAPSAKTLFWTLKAFEKLSRNDSDLVLDVWDRLERKFSVAQVGMFRRRRLGGGGGEGGGPAWTGWKVDKRVSQMVKGHRDRVDELNARRAELGLR
ncbi:hypothetical protein JCM10212_005818 [Sporobolomyces blumeae]